MEVTYDVQMSAAQNNCKNKVDTSKFKKKNYLAANNNWYKSKQIFGCLGCISSLFFGSDRLANLESCQKIIRIILNRVIMTTRESSICQVS